MSDHCIYWHVIKRTSEKSKKKFREEGPAKLGKDKKRIKPCGGDVRNL